MRPVSRAATWFPSFWTHCINLVVSSGSTHRSRIVTEENFLPAYQCSMIIEWAYSQLENLFIYCIKLMLSAAWGSNPATNHTPSSIIEIRQNTEHFSNMINNRRKHVQYFICRKKLCKENRLEAHYQQYHPIAMNEGLLPNEILPPAGFPHLEQSWFEYRRCAWMAIDKVSINNLLIDNIPGAPPPKETPNEEPLDPQQPDITCTADPT